MKRLVLITCYRCWLQTLQYSTARSRKKIVPYLTLSMSGIAPHAYWMLLQSAYMFKCWYSTSEPWTRKEYNMTPRDCSVKKCYCSLLPCTLLGLLCTYIGLVLTTRSEMTQTRSHFIVQKKRGTLHLVFAWRGNVCMFQRLGMRITFASSIYLAWGWVPSNGSSRYPS